MRRFCYLIVLMAAFNWMSHGTQDVYPTFLKSGALGGADLHPAAASWIIVYYTIGAVAGGIVFGALSERMGRRRTMLLTAALGPPVIPLFIFPHNGLPLLVLGRS